MIKIIIGAVIIGFIAISAFLTIDPAIQAAQNAAITEVDDPNRISVSIEGEVQKSGTYTMKEGTTLGDLIETAGGTTNNADYCAFYEDVELTKGGNYFIAPLYDANDICSNKEIEKVNINTDAVSELTKVNGFTTSIATSIVSYRSEHGSFTTIEQLMDVYGIGNATYHKVRSYVVLHS